MPRKSRIQLTPGWAIYLRTNSTDTLKPKQSLERQHDVAYTQVIHQHPLPVYAEYTDIDEEPIYLQKMLDDARLGKFSHIVAKDIRCFGSNAKQVIRIIDELANLGIQVRFADYPNMDMMTKDASVFICLLFGAASHGERHHG